MAVSVEMLGVARRAVARVLTIVSSGGGGTASTASLGAGDGRIAFEQRRSPESSPRPEIALPIGRETDETVMRGRAERGSDRSETAGIAQLRDAKRLLPHALASCGGRLARELIHADYFVSDPRFALAHLACRTRPGRLAPDGVLATLAGRDNYYRWIIERLPRPQMVFDDPALAAPPLLVPSAAPPFVFEAPETAGLRDRIVRRPDGVWPRRRLVVPTRLAHAGDVTATQAAWVRRALGALEHAGARRRVFLSRRDARRRPLVDESALAAALARFGVETIAKGGMTVAQRAALFGACDLVIGPHGAGLANVRLLSARRHSDRDFPGRPLQQGFRFPVRCGGFALRVRERPCERRRVPCRSRRS
ncbi:MAG: DUF563 domain-containing protein [Rubrimonas sp.]